MSEAGRKYVLITPCRDEGKYARRALESVANQTTPPARWVLVDDGSTDETPEILDEYAKKLDFVRVVRRGDRGERSVGPGVIDAFYAGLETIDPDDFEYLCKFDLDLVVRPRYFETLMERMESNPRLGTCSGKPYREQDGRLVPERCGDEMSVGMSKFYRPACFRQIGGFVRQVMWDGIDCHRCRMLGWIARSWNDVEDLRFIHLRPMGSSDQGVLRGRMRHGFGQYFMGTGLVYLAVSSILRMTSRPYIIGGLAISYGYAKSMLTRRERYDDPDFRRFLRRYQRQALLLGKKRATERLNDKQAAIWNPDA